MMNMITFAICDDEPLIAQELAGRLAECMEERAMTDYSVSCFPDGCALLEAVGSFDVIFLDIQMRQPDGMGTAKLLRQRGDHSLLVFVTVLKELVFDAFQVEAYDYLLKPLDSARFHQTMNQVLRALEQRTAEDIVIQRRTVCEVLGRKIYLHKSDGTVSDYYDKLEDLERRVDGRLTGKKLKKWYFAAYSLLLGMIQFLSDRLALDGTLPVGVGVLALNGLSRYGMRNQRVVSWLAAVLSYYVSQLSLLLLSAPVNEG